MVSKLVETDFFMGGYQRATSADPQADRDQIREVMSRNAFGAYIDAEDDDGSPIITVAAIGMFLIPHDDTTRTQVFGRVVEQLLERDVGLKCVGLNAEKFFEPDLYPAFFMWKKHFGCLPRRHGLIQAISIVQVNIKVCSFCYRVLSFQ